jgi:DNA (cytosine-5)-methyltransferase 3A
VGKRNEDGSYSKVHVELPEDRGILLKDVLDGVAWMDKSYTIDGNYHKTLGQQGFDRQSGRRKMAAEPIRTCGGGKAHCMTASYYKCGENPFSEFGNEANRDRIEEPVCVAERGRYTENGIEQRYEAREDGKTNTLTTVQKDNNVCEPVRIGCYPSPDGTLKNSQGMRLYSINGKSVNLTAQGGGLGAKTGLYAFGVPVYAEPIEWDENGNPTKAISNADGKTYPVYEVKNGQITVKGKQYPIKLEDGFYIIRKLTVSECKRLQTVPEWFEFPVSDSQAYKMLGNGWTVSVIAHLIRACLESGGSNEG